MQAWAEKLKKDGGPGVLLSLLLHLLLLLAALWYVHQRPALTEAQLRALPVDLVIGGTMSQQSSTAPAASPASGQTPSRKRAGARGHNPKGTLQPEDELSAKLRALAQLKTPDAALPNADNTAAPGGTGSGEREGNYALKDFIRAQILRRWLPDLSIPGARNLPVLVRIRLSEKRHDR